MMKNIFKKIGALCLIMVVISISACKKLLTQEPKNSTYQEVYWKTASDAKSAVAGNYALLRAALTNKDNRYYLYGDAIAKNYFTIQYTGDGLEGIQGGDFTFQYNLNTLGNYTPYYKAIAMSNIVLKNLAKMTDEQLKDVDNPTAFRNDMMGQALFIRALSYFYLVRTWGDVPIVTEAYDDPINAPQLPRSARALVMKQIEDDCHKASELLSWRYANASDAKVTANRGAVYALLTHLYLWRATMSDITAAPNLADVNNADTTLQALFTNGGYKFTVEKPADSAKYKSTFIGRSSEGIFELNMSENTLEGSNNSVGEFFLNGSYINGQTNDPRYWVLPRYLQSHYGSDTTDMRFRQNFALRDSDEPLCVKYSNVVYRNPGQELNAYLSNNMILFRLSDMYLLQAEIALYRGDAATATDIINANISRYDPNPILVESGLSVDEVMDEYILERGREMYLEGHLFFDLLRTRKYGNVVDWLTDDRFKREGFYWPVDPALFRENPNLRQTTYWLGRV